MSNPLTNLVIFLCNFVALNRFVDMSTENAPGAPVWEASKENIGPVKSGRSTKKLGESVLSAGGLTDVQVKQKQKFEEDIKIAEEGCCRRLDTFVEYFKWTREVYPSNTAKSLEVLEVMNFGIIVSSFLSA